MLSTNIFAFHPPFEPHMKTPEEIEDEVERDRRKSSPHKYLGDENQQREYQKGNSEWAKIE